MRNYNYVFLLVIFMSITGYRAYAYDIAVKTSDGVTFYYNKINYPQKGYEVVGASPSSGNIVIPESVDGYKDSKVISIGIQAFSNCTGLTSVTIPNSVTSIGWYAFSGCTGLTSIEIPNSVTGIGEDAFSGCTGLTSIEIPNSVTKIGEDAFRYCTGLTSLSIGNGLRVIGENAFAGCADLISIVFHCKNVKEWFKWYKSIKEIILGDEVESIGDYAFYGCTGLTSVSIGNSVTSIDRYAFYGCTGLTSVEIPNSVTSIKDNAFSYCTGLTSVSIGNGEKSIKDNAFSDCTGLASIILHCKSVGNWFPQNESVKEIILGDEVESIGDYAFYYFRGLASVTIPNSVTSIGRFAFYGCKGLTSVSIGSGVTSIGAYAFDICPAILTLVSMNTNPPYVGTDTFSNIDKQKCTLYVPKGCIAIYQQADWWKGFLNIRDDAPTGIQSVNNDKDTKISHIYNLNGKTQPVLQRGINIVRTTNGKTKKILIK